MSIKTTTIPKTLLLEATEDSMLSVKSVDLNEKLVRQGIYHDNKLVGFFTPQIDVVRDISYARTGTIYVKPEYRGKGLASQAVLEFFQDKPYGLAHIQPKNISSRTVYEKAGFQPVSTFVSNVNGKTYLLMVKRPLVEIDTKPVYRNW